MSGDTGSQDTPNGDRCKVVDPAIDKRSLYERVMREQHSVSRREIFSSPGASAPEATLEVETHNDGVVGWGSASQTFGINGKQYQVQQSLAGDREFEIGKNAKRELEFGSEEYLTVHALSGKLGAEYYKLPTCKGKTNEK